MARVFSPDPTFSGVCAGLDFQGGVAHCSDPFILGFLAGKGFAIDQEQPESTEKPPILTPDELKSMPKKDLVDYCMASGVNLIGLSDRSSRDEIVARIEAFQDG